MKAVRIHQHGGPEGALDPAEKQRAAQASEGDNAEIQRHAGHAERRPAGDENGRVGENQTRPDVGDSHRPEQAPNRIKPEAYWVEVHLMC